MNILDVIETQLSEDAMAPRLSPRERLRAIARRDFGHLALQAAQTGDTEKLTAISEGIAEALAINLLTVEPENRDRFLLTLIAIAKERCAAMQSILLEVVPNTAAAMGASQ